MITDTDYIFTKRKVIPEEEKVLFIVEYYQKLGGLIFAICAGFTLIIFILILVGKRKDKRARTRVRNLENKLLFSNNTNTNKNKGNKKP